jgi:hypothetical protein
MTMKLKHAIQHSASLKLLLGMLMAISVFSAAANAQPTFAGKFTLLHEVHWGQAVLPAGQYFIRMDSMSPSASISSAKGDTIALIVSVALADNERGGTYLIVTKQGDKRTVRSLNIPEAGKMVIFAPLSRSEREAIARAGQLDTVTVASARK